MKESIAYCNMPRSLAYSPSPTPSSLCADFPLTVYPPHGFLLIATIYPYKHKREK